MLAWYWLPDLCEDESIPFTLSASARFTGTDADAIHLSRGGVPTGLIGLPLRYMHSPVETVDLAAPGQKIVSTAPYLSQASAAPGGEWTLRSCKLISPLKPIGTVLFKFTIRPETLREPSLDSINPCKSLCESAS